MPDWYLEEPEVTYSEQFFISAFFDLSTCRSLGFGVGPIPWDQIRGYGLHYGLDDSTLNFFIAVIRCLDSAYLSWVREKEDAKKAGS